MVKIHCFTHLKYYTEDNQKYYQDFRKNNRSQFQFVTHEGEPQAQMGKNRTTFQGRLQISYCPQLNHSWFIDGKKE